tara:strand:- start:1554 stop:2423 length:870 start_codon:yes stop_codon:yes gene_type:complete
LQDNSVLWYQVFVKKFYDTIEGNQNMQNNFQVTNRIKRKIALLIVSLIFLLTGIIPVSAFDFSDWDALIQEHVTLKVVSGISIHAVNYENLKNDPKFSNFVSRLRSVELDSLKTRDEKLAFWINAYNIFAIKMVVDHYPIKSIKDIGSFFIPVWKKSLGILAGKERTLDEIEHKILRKLDEPRIHVAIVCASVSCPDLRLEAFKAETLNNQLNNQLTAFLKSTTKGMKIDRNGKQIYLSSIFKWFEDDFESRGGVLKFISKYVSPPVARQLIDSDIKISYFPYNWDLNN